MITSPGRVGSVPDRGVSRARRTRRVAGSAEIRGGPRAEERHVVAVLPPPRAAAHRRDRRRGRPRGHRRADRARRRGHRGGRAVRPCGAGGRDRPWRADRHPGHRRSRAVHRQLPLHPRRRAGRTPGRGRRRPAPGSARRGALPGRGRALHGGRGRDVVGGRLQRAGHAGGHRGRHPRPRRQELHRTGRLQLLGGHAGPRGDRPTAVPLQRPVADPPRPGGRRRRRPHGPRLRRSDRARHRRHRTGGEGLQLPAQPARGDAVQAGVEPRAAGGAAHPRRLHHTPRGSRATRARATSTRAAGRSGCCRA